MKIITVFLSVILLSSAISVIPFQESFAFHVVPYTLERQSYITGETIVITAQLIHQPLDALTQVYITEKDNPNPVWKKFIGQTNFLEINVDTSGWASGDYTFTAPNANRNPTSNLIIDFKILPKEFLEIQVSGIVNYGETLHIQCTELKLLPINSTININIRNNEVVLYGTPQNLTFNKSTLDFVIPDNFHSKNIRVDCILIEDGKESVESEILLKLPDKDGDWVPDKYDKCATGDDRIDKDGDGIPNKCDPDEPKTLASLQKNAIPNYDRNTGKITIDYEYDISQKCATWKKPPFTIINNDNDDPFDKIPADKNLMIIPCKGTIVFNETFASTDVFTMYVGMYNVTSIITGDSTTYRVAYSKSLMLDEPIIRFNAFGDFFNEEASRNWSDASIGNDLYVHETTTINYDTDTRKFTTLWPLPTIKKSNDSCADCIPPTLGLNKALQRVVDYGFLYNGNKVQVNPWYTEFPLINATVGILNLVEIKAYENNGINNMRWVQFCIGADERGMPLEKCEVLIEVHLKTNGTTDWIGIKEIKIIDKDNLIENETVTAIAYVVQCMENSPSSNCVKVDLEYEYREETFNHMMIVNVADKPGNPQNFHFNEGVNVIGESLNEPPTITKFVKHSSQDITDNWITYTRTDKITDTWTDQNGIEYLRINDYTFDRITPLEPWVCNDAPLDQVKVPTRTNCHFRAIMPHLWQN